MATVFDDVKAWRSTRGYKGSGDLLDQTDNGHDATLNGADPRPHDGANHAYFNSTATTNYLDSAPTTGGTQRLAMEVSVALDTYSPASNQNLATYHTNRPLLRLDTGDNLLVFYRDSGGTQRSHTAPSQPNTLFADKQRVWFRVTIYDDGADTFVDWEYSTNGIDWTAWGTTTRTGETGFDGAGSDMAEIGRTSQGMAGRVYSVKVWQDGVEVVNVAPADFEPTRTAYSTATQADQILFPTSTDFDVTTGLSLRFEGAADDWTKAGNEDQLFGRWAGSNQCFLFRMDNGSTGLIELFWSEDGSASKSAKTTVNPGFTDATKQLLRADLDFATGDVTFYIGTDRDTWYVHEVVSGAGATSVFTGGTSPLGVACTNHNSTDAFVGETYWAAIYDGSSKKFEVDFTDQVPGATSVTATTGHVSTTLDGDIVADGQLQIHDSTPTYMELDGDTDEASVPWHSSQQLATSIELRLEATADLWNLTASDEKVLISAWASGIESFLWRLDNTNGIEFFWRDDAPATQSVSTTSGPNSWGASSKRYLNVTYVFATGAWTMGEATSRNGKYTVFDSGTGATGTPFTVTSIAIKIGGYDINPLDSWAGQIHWAQVTINGVIVADVDFSNLAPGVISFTEDSSIAATVTFNGDAIIVGGPNQWVVNRATSGYTTTIVDGKAPLLLDGSNDYTETADHADLDIDADDDFTVIVCHRAHNLGTGTLIGKRAGVTAGDTGWGITFDSSGIPTVEISDGVDEASDAGVAVEVNALVTTGFTLNRTTDELELFQNGVGTGSPTDTTSVGDCSNALAVRVGTESDGGVPWDGEYLGDAIFNRVLTGAEFLEAHQRLLEIYTGQTQPDGRLHFAFGNDPMDASVTWTDATAYMRKGGFTISRGRSNEFDTPRAGTARILVDNRDARFNPWNTNSPHSPNVVPVVPCRIGAIWQATKYTLFRGFVESWPTKWPEKGTDAVVEITAVDGFKGLAFHEDATAQGQELSGTRVGDLLTLASWPTAARDLDAGQFSVAAYTPNCEAILGLIQDVARTEDGLFFIAANGDATFQDSIFRDAATGPTYGDDPNAPDELPYEDLEVVDDESQIWNEVKVETVDGSSVSVSDATSQTSYWKRSLKQFDVHSKDATDATTLANAILARFKDAQTRIEEIRINPHAPGSDWHRILTDDISTKALIKRRPPGNGTPLTKSVFIEGIALTGQPFGWRAAYQLSPYS